MKKKIPATLYLADGTSFTGEAFGAPHNTDGEVVFSTGMVGYPESMTDPSFEGQILVTTYPLIGNYGVPNDPLESDRIHVRALVVQNYVDDYSHADTEKSLDEWMREEGIPGISGIDTRALTKHLREKGAQLGAIVVGKNPKKPNMKAIVDPNTLNLVEMVSPTEPTVYNAGKGYKKIVLVDTGMKNNILQELIARDVEVKHVPWNYDYTKEEWDGLFISNGPGDPAVLTETIGYIAKALKTEKPVFGICLGSQLMALAAGAKTYKLKYGHRSQNQPCIDLRTGRCYLTTQNHGFAVDQKTLKKDWELWFVNANDGTTEGIRHKQQPHFSVQFHPESTPGPEDTTYLFDEFVDIVNGRSKKKH